VRADEDSLLVRQLLLHPLLLVSQPSADYLGC
jgi:hypothetical protein